MRELHSKTFLPQEPLRLENVSKWPISRSFAIIRDKPRFESALLHYYFSEPRAGAPTTIRRDLRVIAHAPCIACEVEARFNDTAISDTTAN